MIKAFLLWGGGERLTRLKEKTRFNLALAFGLITIYPSYLKMQDSELINKHSLRKITEGMAFPFEVI